MQIFLRLSINAYRKQSFVF